VLLLQVISRYSSKSIKQKHTRNRKYPTFKRSVSTIDGAKQATFLAQVPDSHKKASPEHKSKEIATQSQILFGQNMQFLHVAKILELMN